MSNLLLDPSNESSNDASNQMMAMTMKSSSECCFYTEDSNMISNDESNDKCDMVNDENSNAANSRAPIQFEEPPAPITETNCYCGADRNLNTVELQCAKCLKWFHEQCISIHLGRLVRFLTTYIFYCKNCSPTKIESFKRTQANFSQICQTAIANLMQQYSSENRIAFSKDKEIIPFIDKHWSILSNKSRPQKNTWHSSIFKVMQKDSETFICDNRDPDDILFALRYMDITKIAPNYENLKKELNGAANANSNMNISSRSLRGVKKRLNLPDGSSEMIHLGKRQKSELSIPKLPASGFPSEFPYNKEGYRYVLAEPDDNAPFRKEFEERHEFAGKAIPGWLCRKLMPESLVMSMNDRAHFLKISEDRKTVIGEKGYCSIRATNGVSHGTWYYEVKINEMPENAATRIGWAQELANLFTPLGYDKFGYSWRSRKGTRFHESIGKHYADEGFGLGDVIGCLIHLPREEDPCHEIPLLPKTYKDKPLIKFKSFMYFEEKDEAMDKAVKALRPLPGSKIVFFKNGRNIGTAFENIYRGLYYPAAGLYKSISITFNFGPDFAYPPRDDPEFGQTFRGMNEAVFDSQIEQTLADIIFLVEHEGKLSLDHFYSS